MIRILLLLLVASCAQAQVFSINEFNGDDSRLINATVNNATVNPNAAGATAGYFTNYKQNVGASFGIVSEVEDFSGIGSLWGIEIDAMSTGSGVNVNTMSRRGLGVVVGVTGGTDATIGYGIQVLPFYPNIKAGKKVDVAYGVSVNVHCRIACVAVPVGEKIALSEDGIVSLRYNPQTVRIEFLYGDVVKGSVDMR